MQDASGEVPDLAHLGLNLDRLEDDPSVVEERRVELAFHTSVQVRADKSFRDQVVVLHLDTSARQIPNYSSILACIREKTLIAIFLSVTVGDL